MKTMFFDVETTGLDPAKNGIIQLAAIFVEDGREVDRVDIRIDPRTYCREMEISQEALAVNQTSLSDLDGYLLSEEGFEIFLQKLDSFVDKYDKNDKIIPVGYNSTKFDIPFLQAWFEDNGNPYYGSYFDYKDIDVFALVKLLGYLRLLSLPNQKLATVCKHFSIDIDAHEAMSDIVATRRLLDVLTTAHISAGIAACAG